MTRYPQYQTALAATVLILLTITNAAWTFREPLMQHPVFSRLASKVARAQLQPSGLLKAPEQIHLISQDLHAHPTLSGVLVLSLSLMNYAPHAQVFPVLEITLFDAANQPVARRRFQPINYLRPDTNTQSGLATDMLMPILLELADPGAQAVGFEIQFL